MFTALLIAAALTAAPQIVTGAQDAYPALSPDGETLAFQSTRNGRWAIYLADADGANVRILIDSGDDPVTPSWSPDGRRIAFAASVDGQSEIFVIDQDGSNRRRLTDHPGDDSHPHFGPDGRIFFNSPRATPDPSLPWAEQYHDIYSMGVDGSGLRRHTRCRAVCTFPSVSPDGHWLAYRKVLSAPGRNWRQEPIARNSEIFVSSLHRRGEINVSNDPAFDGWPVWSPDSQWIGFSSNRGGTPLVGQVYVVRPDGRDLQRVSTSSLSQVQPSFTPGGRAILASSVFETPDGEFSAIVRWPFTPLP